MTASGNVTLNQDGTINSLAIHNGNTLQYQAATAQALTVGTNVTVDAGGALSMTAGGDKLAVAGTVGKAGTFRARARYVEYACFWLRYAILRRPPAAADAVRRVAAECAQADGSIG